MINNDKNRFEFGSVLQENLEYNEHKFNKLNEDKKIKIADKVLAKLLTKVKSKYNKKYFETISATKGDVTKLKDFKNLVNMISLLDKLECSDFPQFKDYVQSVSDSLNIVTARTQQFKKAYANNNQVLILLYESVVASIIEGTVLICTNFVDYEVTQFNNYKLVVKRKKVVRMSKTLKDSHIFKCLDKFIDLHKNRKLDKLNNFENKLNEELITAGVTAGMVVYALAWCAVPVIVLFACRCCVFTYYNTKYLIADKMKYIAKVLEMNLSTLEKNEKNDKIREKQEKIIEWLRNTAEKFESDNTVSESKSTDEAKKDDEELKKEADDTNDDVLI